MEFNQNRYYLTIQDPSIQKNYKHNDHHGYTRRQFDPFSDLVFT